MLARLNAALSAEAKRWAKIEGHVFAEPEVSTFISGFEGADGRRAPVAGFTVAVPSLELRALRYVVTIVEERS